MDYVNEDFTVRFRTGEDEDGNDVYEKRTITYGKAMMDTSVQLNNLTITNVSTTTNPDSKSKGAMSVTVTDASGKKPIVLRTEVLYKDDDTLYTEADFKNSDGSWKTISSVKGIVDYFDLNNTGDGSYQIAVWDWSCFTFA